MRHRLNAIHEIGLEPERAAVRQFADLLARLAVAVKVVEYQKAFHGRPRNQNLTQEPLAGVGLVEFVGQADCSNNDDSRADGKIDHRRIVDRACGVVEKTSTPSGQAAATESLRLLDSR